MTSGEPRPASSGWKRPLIRWSIQTIALFGLWLALSGHFSIEFLVIGALTSAGAAVFTNRLFRGTHEGKHRPAPASARWLVVSLFRLLAYFPWLAYQIVVSNVHVVYLVLHPRMPIYPSLVEFDTSLESEYARVLLAQSITVTPGTVTIDASEGKLLVHCLSNKSRQGLADGDIQRKVAWVFDEPAAEVVEVHDIEYPSQVPQ